MLRLWILLDALRGASAAAVAAAMADLERLCRAVLPYLVTEELRRVGARFPDAQRQARVTADLIARATALVPKLGMMRLSKVGLAKLQAHGSPQSLFEEAARRAVAGWARQTADWRLWDVLAALYRCPAGSPKRDKARQRLKRDCAVRLALMLRQELARAGVSSGPSDKLLGMAFTGVLALGQRLLRRVGLKELRERMPTDDLLGSAAHWAVSSFPDLLAPPRPAPRPARRPPAASAAKAVDYQLRVSRLGTAAGAPLESAIVLIHLTKWEAADGKTHCSLAVEVPLRGDGSESNDAARLARLAGCKVWVVPHTRGAIQPEPLLVKLQPGYAKLTSDDRKCGGLSEFADLLSVDLELL